MSQMLFSIRDAAQSIHSQRHPSFVDVIVPALSDDPETIPELEHAMRRFLPPDGDAPLHVGWEPGDGDAAPGADVFLVDLAARLIGMRSASFDLIRFGEVTYGDENTPKSQWIPYRIADDWHVREPDVDWAAEAGARRREREANPPWDTRSVLYGQVSAFIVDQCLEARGGSIGRNDEWTPPPGWQWWALPERAAKKKSMQVSDAIAEIHARWLMRPRDDLGGRTPRDLLHDRRSEIMFQLQDRELQWARSGTCPPGLWRDSVAYRCGGYGTHEIVVYYELVRHLVEACWDMVVERRVRAKSLTRDAAVERLGAVQQEWLHTPNDEEYRGRPPIHVIERERLRLPLASTGEEAMIDCDCPMCRMMADGGPVFWSFDGSHLDDDFAFAVFEETREEWEETQREWAELDADEDERKTPIFPRAVGVSSAELDAIGDERSDTIWQRSYSSSESVRTPTLTLMGLACHLAELFDDIRRLRTDPSALSITGDRPAPDDVKTLPRDRSSVDVQTWIDTLNRDLTNLRDAVSQSSAVLVDPVAARFSEHLLALAEARPSLTVKCLDLDRQINALSDRLSGDQEIADNAPF
jgi:hypothetical protein